MHVAEANRRVVMPQKGTKECAPLFVQQADEGNGPDFLRMRRGVGRQVPTMDIRGAVVKYLRIHPERQPVRMLFREHLLVVEFGILCRGEEMFFRPPLHRIEINCVIVAAETFVIPGRFRHRQVLPLVFRVDGIEPWADVLRAANDYEVLGLQLFERRGLRLDCVELALINVAAALRQASSDNFVPHPPESVDHALAQRPCRMARLRVHYGDLHKPTASLMIDSCNSAALSLAVKWMILFVFGLSRSASALQSARQYSSSPCQILRSPAIRTGFRSAVSTSSRSCRLSWVAGLFEFCCCIRGRSYVLNCFTHMLHALQNFLALGRQSNALQDGCLDVGRKLFELRGDVETDLHRRCWRCRRVNRLILWYVRWQNRKQWRRKRALVEDIRIRCRHLKCLYRLLNPVGIVIGERRTLLWENLEFFLNVHRVDPNHARLGPRGADTQRFDAVFFENARAKLIRWNLKGVFHGLLVERYPHFHRVANKLPKVVQFVGQHHIGGLLLHYQ